MSAMVQIGDLKVQKSNDNDFDIGIEIDAENELGSLVAVDGQSRPKSKLPYPKRVFFIICNAFCERFNYYGVRGNY